MRWASSLLLLLLASCASADERCWMQAGEGVNGFEFRLAGVPIDVHPISMGLRGDEGEKWCVVLPELVGTYEWDVSVLYDGGAKPSSNGPLTQYRSTACRVDLNTDGAVGMNDVGAVMGLVGESCL